MKSTSNGRRKRINLTSQAQYLKRWNQYYESDDTFIFIDQLSITQDGVEIIDG
jgi:hypothetical protein